MARVYAVASAKGGVGKTTLTANLGVVCAAAGLDVAVVDADLGMPNLGRLLGISPDGATLHDVLAGDAQPLDAVYDGPEGIAVIPGDGTLDAYAAADPRALRTVVDALTAYDVVLVDTGGGLSHDTVLPLGLADGIVLVTTPSPDAFGDTKKTRQLADRLDVPVAGLVVTRLDREGVDTDGLAAHLDVPLLGVIPEDPLDVDSTGGLAVTRDPDSAVAVAYRTLADAVLPAADVDFDVTADVDDDGDGPDPDTAEQDRAATTAEATADADADARDDTTAGADDSAEATDATAGADDAGRTDGAADVGDVDTDAGDTDADTDAGDLDVDELDLSSVLDDSPDEATEAFDAAFDLDEDAAAETDAGSTRNAEAADTTDTESTGTDAESLDAADAPDTESPADVADGEARPTSDRSPAGERGVTIEPDPEEPAAVPDAEDRATETDADDVDDAREEHDSDEGTNGGLFGRFFG